MPIISALRLICQDPQSTNSTKLFISTPSHSKTEFEAQLIVTAYCSDTDHSTDGDN